MYFFYDQTYILIIIATAIAMFAQSRVRSTFDKYSEWQTARHVSGREAAQQILDANGIHDVTIERIAGFLTDHYDPSNKVLRLSDATYDKTSVAAVAVAAHECGHAIQDAQDYALMRIRATIVPIVNIGSSLSMPLILIGIILGLSKLVTVGLIAFSLVLVFQLITLPVEFDASRRALVVLERSVFTADEIAPARSVLRAAAFTYVAAALGTALQIIRFILMNNRRRN